MPDDDDLADLSPARTTTYKRLADVQPATYREVAAAADFKPETTRDALHHLRECGLVERRRDPADARRRLWSRVDGE
jgi:DNA-binding MarR family transcriptional regulator